jgi:hypothetical protein
MSRVQRGSRRRCDRIRGGSYASPRRILSAAKGRIPLPRQIRPFAALRNRRGGSPKRSQGGNGFVLRRRVPPPSSPPSPFPPTLRQSVPWLRLAPARRRAPLGTMASFGSADCRSRSAGQGMRRATARTQSRSHRLLRSVPPVSPARGTSARGSADVVRMLARCSTEINLTLCGVRPRFRQPCVVGHNA